MITRHIVAATLACSFIAAPALADTLAKVKDSRFHHHGHSRILVPAFLPG